MFCAAIQRSRARGRCRAIPRVCVHLRDGRMIEVPCKSNTRAKSTYNYLVEDWGKARAVARSIGGGDAE